MALESTKTLNGAFGKLCHEGNHLTHVFGLEVNVDINYEEIRRSGTRSIGHKATTTVSSGTISGYKVTNEFADAIAQILDDSKGAFVTELHAQIDDPENPEMSGFYRIKGVQFNRVPAINFEHGSIVEEELPFVCDGFERM